jgi:hypothetical protein
MKSEIFKRTKHTSNLLNLPVKFKKIQSAIFSFPLLFTKFYPGFDIGNLTVIKVNSTSTGSTQFYSVYI